MSKSKQAEALAGAMTAPRRAQATIADESFVSTGSTLLNLAITNRPDCGFAKGTYIYLVGDSSSGKTFLSLTCLAEAANNPNFDEYRLIHDDAENGALMDFAHFFGEKCAARIEPPSGTLDEPVMSDTIESFYFHIDKAVKAGKPFIYILDSADALRAVADDDKFDDARAAYEKGKEVAGSYGTAKAKGNSQNLGRVAADLRDTGSILIIISQTRDNIGFGSQYNPKTRSGGKALTFYATMEMWSSVVAMEKKTILGKPRDIGKVTQVRLKKNRVTGRDRQVNIPFYYSFGFDDIGGNIEYLLEEGHWTEGGKKRERKKSDDDDDAKGKGAKTIDAPEFDFNGSKEKLIKMIDDNDKHEELKQLVTKVWNSIESACTIERKQRYS